MRSLYGNAGFRALTTLISLQLLMFIGVLVGSFASMSDGAPGAITQLSSVLIVGAFAGFLIVTGAALTEAVVCLGFLEWKKYFGYLRSLLLLLPISLVAGGILRVCGALVWWLPVLSVSVAGMLITGFALVVIFRHLREERWRNRRYDRVLAHVTGEFDHTLTRRLLQSIYYQRGVIRNNPFQTRRGLSLTDLPSRPWRSESEFPWRESIMEACGKIRTEAAAVCRRDRLDEYAYPGHVSGTWNVFWLVRDNRVVPQAEVLCPCTLRALGHVPGFPCMREAHFSVLEPHSRILPHADESNFWLTAHLGLEIPQKCGMRVGGESRKWQTGEFLFFDTTYEHEAWNDSDCARVILLFDFLNPELNAAEREFALRRERKTDTIDRLPSRAPDEIGSSATVRRRS